MFRITSRAYASCFACRTLISNWIDRCCKYTWEKTARIACHDFETNGRPYLVIAYSTNLVVIVPRAFRINVQYTLEFSQCSRGRLLEWKAVDVSVLLLSFSLLSFSCFSYCLTQNKGDPKKMRKSLIAIVPHAFGDHKTCEENKLSWCKWLQIQTRFPTTTSQMAKT